jgi:hypothetical protein
MLRIMRTLWVSTQHASPRTTLATKVSKNSTPKMPEAKRAAGDWAVLPQRPLLIDATAKIINQPCMFLSP